MANTQKKGRTHMPVEGHSLESLRNLNLENLISLAEDLNVENPSGLRRQDLIFEILRSQVTKGGYILFSGTLEIINSDNNNYGFLRSTDVQIGESIHDAYVSGTQIRKFALRNGDVVTGQVRSPKEKEKYYALLKVEAINLLPVDESRHRPLFENLVPMYPMQQLKLEYNSNKLTGRMMDLFTPIGKGQRGLIVAPPRSGKTEILKELAHGVSENHSEAELIVLLIDERPEEVTDMQRSVNGDVYSSTFDQPARNHIKVAEIVIEKAKRRVELGKDVVILLDSITRLARAYNAVIPSSGKVLSGGVDANALHKPKKFFGAARNIENGGSLTIIATALIETGSKMDEVIFEEFKGTGNCEIVLSRTLSDRRIYPSMDILKSGTRKEELILGNDRLQKAWVLRNALQNPEVAKDEVDALRFLYSKMLKTKTNEEFLSIMNEGS